MRIFSIVFRDNSRHRSRAGRTDLASNNQRLDNRDGCNNQRIFLWHRPDLYHRPRTRRPGPGSPDSSSSHQDSQNRTGILVTLTEPYFLLVQLLRMTFCQDLLSSPLHKVCILRHRGSTDRSRSPPGNQYHTCSILSMLVPYRRQRTVRRGQGFLGSSSTLQGNQHRTGILVTCLLPVVFLSVL